MITRPLDLAAKLRPEPRNFDWIFIVNGGLIALFFSFFGSRFVLAPGFGVDFALPAAVGATANAQTTTDVITVVNAGQIFAGDGFRTVDQLKSWLLEQKKNKPHPSLLVRASAGVPITVLAQIASVAKEAGFSVTIAAKEAPGGVSAPTHN
jgi:biopolymer transport protein ExbD